MDYSSNDSPAPGDVAFVEVRHCGAVFLCWLFCSSSARQGASQLCLDLLTQITLLNEHRILMIWVLVYEHMVCGDGGGVWQRLILARSG